MSKVVFSVEHRPKGKDVSRIQIVCRACGWKWTPDPHRWRNHDNKDTARTMRCSSCGMPNRLSREDVKKILKYNN